MMDAEAAFVEHEENMKLQEELVSFVVEKAITEFKKEFSIIERNTELLAKIKPPFYRLTYGEALKNLQELGSNIKMEEDFGGDDKTMLPR